MSGKDEGDGRFHIEGIAHSRLWGDWPFDSHITHSEHPDKGEYTAAWNETDKGELAVNRGHWQLRPFKDQNQTLLVYALQVETEHYPAFLVRNIIMDRLPSVVRAVGNEVKRRAS
jgi:hypothetical protein